jgi:hypothetical protein
MLFDDCFRRLVDGHSANGPARKISTKKLLTAPLAASVVLSSGILIFEPTRAQAVAILAAVTCSSSSPCATWQNKGSGNAIQATAAGDSIHAISTGSAKSGVFGETDAKSGGYGVKGTNTAAKGIGVYGSGGAGTGVEGATTGPAASFGVYGTATSGTGVYGQSVSGTGIYAQSSSGLGLFAYSASNQSLVAESFSSTINSMDVTNFGTPNPASSSYPFASQGARIYAQHATGALIENGDPSANGVATFANGRKYGAVVGGQNFGLIAVDGAGIDGYPLEAGSATPGGAETGFFDVDGAGDISYTGNASSYARTRDGANVTAFETKATQASFEDTGTAQLVAGSAFVSLDPAFARALDLRSPYRVFLTPDGDTRGLYVAGKTPTGFTVRETQGGRGTFAFDYRIIGSAAGGTGERTTLVTPAVEARFFPMLAGHRRMNESSR